MRSGALIAGALCVAGFATLPARAPTDPEITEADLRARLEAFAHDSMEGRFTGTRGHARAVAYLVSELARIGARPVARQSSYTQALPLARFQLDVASARIIVATDRWAGNLDSLRFTKRLIPGLTFLPILGELGVQSPLEARAPRSGSVLPLVYGGRLGDSNAIAPRIVRGIAVMFAPPLRRNGQPDYDLWPVRDHLLKYQQSALILVATLDLMPRSVIARLSGPRLELTSRDVDRVKMPPIAAITRGMLSLVTELPQETHSGAMLYTSHTLSIEAPAYNVIAVVEGSDADLRSEFVLVSAHSDHRGLADSTEKGADRVYNGADGGGSGAVALLEIAERIAAMPVKPKRSIAFIWTAGHDQGFLGSEYFIDHPTISRGRIAASISVDRLGRSDTIEVRGATRLSTEWRALLDSTISSADHPTRAVAPDLGEICSGDDWNYTRRGVPSAQIAAGINAELFSVRDEVTRIDFAALARNTQLVLAMVERAANRNERPRKDKPEPHPRQPCAT